MAIRSMIKILPEIKSIHDDFNNGNKDIEFRILAVYEKINLCFGQIPEELIIAKNELIENPNEESASKWLNMLMQPVFNSFFSVFK